MGWRRLSDGVSSQNDRIPSKHGMSDPVLDIAPAAVAPSHSLGLALCVERYPIRVPHGDHGESTETA